MTKVYFTQFAGFYLIFLTLKFQIFKQFLNLFEF